MSSHIEYYVPYQFVESLTSPLHTQSAEDALFYATEQRMLEEEREKNKAVFVQEAALFRQHIGADPITDADGLQKLFESSGVAVSYAPYSLLEKDTNHIGEPREVSYDDEKLYPDVPKPPLAFKCNTFVHELFKFAQTNSLDVPEELEDLGKYWFSHEFIPPGRDWEEQKARSDSKKPALVALNQAMHAQRSLKPTETIKCLSFGCGDGGTDISRFVESNNKSRYRIEVDLYDPIVPISPNARGSTEQYKVRGRDYPKVENYAFPPNLYDVILCMNTIHYNAKPTGGVYRNIINLFQSLKPGGIVCGMFPSLNGIAVCGRNTELAEDRPPEAYMSLLAIESGQDGCYTMVNRTFGEVYHEPILEPSVLQSLMSQCGVYGQVFDGGDYDKVLDKQTKLSIPSVKIRPELNAFHCFYGVKTTTHDLGGNFELAYRSECPFEFDLENGEDHSSFMTVWPLTIPNTGKPLGSKGVWKFLSGGPWLFSEKTDGLTANCRAVGGQLYIFVPGKKTVIIPIKTAIDMSFQAEAVPHGLRYQLTLVQVNAYNGHLWSFGSGLLLAHQLRRKCFLENVNFKSWTYNVTPLMRVCGEGLVIMNFSASPPRYINNGGPLERKTGTAFYVKRTWSIDILFQGKSVKSVNNVECRIPSNADPLGVHEFDLTGSYIRPRPEKKKGNSDLVIASNFGAVNWYEFENYLLKRYYSKWRPVSGSLPFLNEPESEWKLKDQLLLSISYPRGFINIKDLEKRKLIYGIRKRLYDTSTLNSVLLSDTYNRSNESRYDEVLGK